MPDIPPFEMPEGGLTATDQVLPSVLGYRGLGYGSDSDLATIADAYVRGGMNFADDPQVLYWGTEAKLYKDSTNKSRASASAPYLGAQWVYQKYGDWIIATNGEDPVQVLKTSTGNFQNLGGMPPAAQYCLVFGERLILANLNLAIGIGTTDTRVASSNFDYYVAGTPYNKTAVTAGTALAAGTIPQNKYGIYRFTIDSAGTITCTAGAANFTTGYNTEALAIAALPAVPANNAQMGYITVMSTHAAGFVGNTDALKGGSSGNPAAFTNYYVDTTYRSKKKLFWSALAALENWTPSITTGCNYQDMPDLKGEITGLALLPNGFAVISENSTAIGYLTRGVYVFNFSIVERDVGARPGTVVSANHGVFFASERDFRFFNGAQTQPIGLPLRLTVLGAVGYSTTSGEYLPASVTSARFFSVCHDMEEKNIYWCYYFINASSQYVSHIIAYNYYLDQWTYFDGLTQAADSQWFGAVYYDHYNRCLAVVKGNVSGTQKYVKALANAATTAGDITTREFYIPDSDGFPAISAILRVRPKSHLWTVEPVVTVSSRMNEDDTPSDTTVTVSSVTGWADTANAPASRYHRIKATLGGGIIKKIDVEFEVVGRQ